MIINQQYMDDYVIKPIMEKFDKLEEKFEKRFDELEQLIKSIDKDTKMKMSWMSNSIAKLPKTKKRAK